MSAKQKIEEMPVAPDPLWPTGVIPAHLSPTEKENKQIVDAYVAGAAWKCEKCGSTVGRVAEGKYCNKCYVVEQQNTALAQKTNSDWMECSSQIGLQIFERQPEESDLEWLVWSAYRDHYPMRMPTWTELAKECNTTVALVLKAKGRWSWPVRIQAWARFCDASMQEKRLAAVQEMNDRQTDMAKKLQMKLLTAIEQLDATTLKPSEINSLLKTASDLERRIALSLPERVEQEAIVADKTATKQTKVTDLGEVMSILAGTGLIDGAAVGLRQTTEVVIKQPEVIIDDPNGT